MFKYIRDTQEFVEWEIIEASLSCLKRIADFPLYFRVENGRVYYRKYHNTTGDFAHCNLTIEF